jgi:hypothetical protein
MLLSVIGTSQIIEEHLQSAVKNGFKLHSISTTKNIESINLKKIYKKYSFKKKYSNWKQMYLDTKNYKNMTYLVCPRIKDTLSISNFFLHNKKIIFVEKPLSTNKKSYSELEKYKKQIFVGYNRVYYENLKYLKSQKFSNSLVNVNCVEKNNKSFIENSCHIVSIINFLFDDLKIIYRFKNKNHIFCRLYSKKKKIFVNFLVTFNVPKNFSIEIFNKKKVYELKPIERMKIYNKISRIKSKKGTFFEPVISIDRSEYEYSNLKPGFENQWKKFKLFIKTKKTDTNLKFAKSTITLALDILGKK